MIQAHPFFEASYIDHIRLFPRHIHGVEVFNACRKDFTNEMAKHFADAYELIHFAGTDNHRGKDRAVLAGMETDIPIENEQHFVELVLKGRATPFHYERIVEE